MRSFFLVFVAGFASLVFAVEPVGLQGIDVGMKAADIVPKLQANNPGACFSTTCEQIVYVKEISLKAHYIFNSNSIENPEALLDRIIINFNPRLYDILKSALIEKYGPTKLQKLEKLQNMAGAEFLNETLLWKLTDGNVVLTKYSGKISEGEISMASRGWLDEIKKEREKQKVAPGF